MQGATQKVVRAIALLFLTLAVALLVVRSLDGPIGIIPGGPFTSGERYEGPEPDWSFVRDIDEVEFQLLEPARSRTTWIVEHEGRAYIACGYMKSLLGKLWKQWPHEAVLDGRALLRIEDRVYPRKLVRIQQGPQLLPVLQRFNEKYIGAERPMSVDTVNRGEIWLFELTPGD